MPKLSYTVLDVFTATPYAGNQLALVDAGAEGSLTTAQQHQICKEFGFAETVFYHLPPSGAEGGDEIPVRIFSPGMEIPWAGHPTIGTGFYFLSELSGSAQRATSVTLRTKAGRVPITRSATGSSDVRVQVPVDFKIHVPVSLPSVKALQGALSEADYAAADLPPSLLADSVLPVVSIVRGMSWVLLETASEDALARLQPYPSPPQLPAGHLGEWQGEAPAMVYAFFVESAPEGAEQAARLRARMFYGAGCEDAATGSAAAALCSWLAVTGRASRPGSGGRPGGECRSRRFEVLQGTEMGRPSKISVEVDVGAAGQQVVAVALEGKAVQTMEGTLVI